MEGSVGEVVQCLRPLQRARAALLLAALCGGACLSARGEERAALGAAAPPWDTWSDTWVATDALGRSLPGREQVGPPRTNKWVGIFYFLLAADPDALAKPESPLWGPLGAPHHWGEPLFGYYVSDDEAVLAKHAQMLADAGVDAVIFDVTNQLTYPRSWQALCRVFDRIRRLGGRTPQLAFLCPFGDPRRVVQELWEQLYSRNLYPDLWFRWEGKPLILADPAAVDAAPIREFFTFRKPQPDYFAGPGGPGQWGWLEVYPQHAFFLTPGVPEEVTVGVAQNAVDGKLSVLSNPRSRGRSFHDGAEPGPEGQDASGRNVAEQWRRALERGPLRRQRALLRRRPGDLRRRVQSRVQPRH